MKKILSIVALLGLLIPSISQATLYDFYEGNLPSIKERSVLYSEIADDTYYGTASQNNALENYLRGNEVLGATTKIKLTDENSVTPSATTTPTASKIPIADGSGSLKQWTEVKSFTAGEDLTGATTPQAVYYDTTSSSVKVCDGNDTAKLNFLGFAIESVSSTESVKVQVSGIVNGFTGLVEGSYYYVQDDKTIGISKGTYEIQVGVAISETELLIQKGIKYASGVKTFTGTGTETITTNFQPSNVRISGIVTNFTSQGGWTKFGGNKCVGEESTTPVSDSTNAWHLGSNGSNKHEGLIDTITSTGFRLNNTITGTPGNLQIYWEAEGN